MKPNLNKVTLKISAGRPDQFPSDGLPQIAFSGRSNVGKSSLVNTLLGRKKLARVSGEPGKTITINFYDIDRQFYFVDLPGYGYARRSFEDIRRWSSLTDGFFTKNKNLDALKLVCQLIDARVGPTEDDRDMLTFLREASLPHLIVATKEDKLNATEKAAFSSAISAEPLAAGTPVLLFSAKSGRGRDELWRAIYEAIGESEESGLAR